MTLRQMEYFLAVVEEGSFSRAASRLNVTQPALSQQVKALEDDLGTPLVERLGRGVRITAAGRAYLPHARSRSRRAAGAAAQSRDVVRRDGRRTRAGDRHFGRRRRAAAAAARLARATAQRRDPPVRSSRIAVRSRNSSPIGNADLAVGPTPVSWEGESVPLGHERFVLILSRDDPAARELKRYRGKPPRARGASPSARCRSRRSPDHQWVLFDRANGLSEFVEGHLASAGLSGARASLRTTPVHDGGDASRRAAWGRRSFPPTSCRPISPASSASPTLRCCARSAPTAAARWTASSAASST